MSTVLDTLPARVTSKPMSDVLDVVQHLDKLWELANVLIKSRMLPSSISTPEAAVAIILKGRELGIGAMAAFAGITVIQGKPVVSPQLMLSLINREAVLEDMRIDDDGQCCRVTMKRRGRSPHTASFSMDNAREMQLAGKDNWKKMPAIMRQWRAVAACARVVCPDVIDGMYTPEEMGAEVNEDGEIIDGEVVEEYRPTAPVKSAPGLFTKDHVQLTQEFNAWISEQCKKINEKWQAEWDDRLQRFQADGVAVPEKVADVINPWQAKGHLLKWAMDTGRLDDGSVPSDPKTRQTDAYVALVYHDPDERGALKTEMGQYLVKQRQLKSDAIYRKHPELAPDGWAEEQQEAASKDRGDAYEGDESTAGE